MENTIIIRLAGGLGNQIFQIGASLLLADKINCRRIILDDSALGKYQIARVNELNNFFDFSSTPIVFKNKALTKLRLPKLIPLKLNAYPFISDRNFQHILQHPNKYFHLLDGYFQDCLTQTEFNKIVEILLAIVRSPKPTLEIDVPTCVIHIRGGDFLKIGWSTLTPKSYYTAAMQDMQKKYNINKFIIVTDDIGYAKTIYEHLPYEIEIISNDIVSDFYTIGHYSHRILSSSTFALWASVLSNENTDDGCVIIPKYLTPGNLRPFNIKNEMSREH